VTAEAVDKTTGEQSRLTITCVVGAYFYKGKITHVCYVPIKISLKNMPKCAMIIAGK
jgi:hypothetical protein